MNCPHCGTEHGDSDNDIGWLVVCLRRQRDQLQAALQTLVDWHYYDAALAEAKRLLRREP